MSLLRLSEAFADHSIRVKAAALDREHAIELVGQLLVASGRTTPDYTDAMVQVLDSHGPYFVIAPGIALAHAKPAEHVLTTGLSLLTLAEPIMFGNEANDPVELVFGLCATDHDSHIDILAELSTLLSDNDAVNILLNAGDPEQIRSLFQ